MRSELIDITKEFISRSTPGIGSISYEDGLDIKTHVNEIRTARWLLNTFGGNITVLKEKNLYKIKTPDYEWNGKLWELKSPSSNAAIQEAIRKAYKQIKELSGGIIIDLVNYKGTYDVAFISISHSLEVVSKKKGYIIIKSKNKLIKVYATKKRS